ncbi:MAG: hypothetical protein NVS4B12_25970 [Ktedonobacteraceae bacterium]
MRKGQTDAASVKVKGQQEEATEEYDVYGWKVLVLIEVHTRLPLAMKVVKIQDYEGSWLIPLLEQAQRNLGSAAQIEKIVIDRGYLDGADLWSVNKQGIIFVICGKANMSVTQDAQGVAKGERAVVRKWENREPKTGGTVYLTNASVRDPFEVFDSYDWRSVIENGIFKEGKHPWHVLNFPKRNEAAVVVHCHLTLLVMGLTTAFRFWQAQSAAAPSAQTKAVPSLSSALLGGEGTARWRKRLQEENRDKIIVFLGQHYGIFFLAEFAVLTHIPIRILPSPLGTPQAVLHRFGISP